MKTIVCAYCGRPRVPFPNGRSRYCHPCALSLLADPTLSPFLQAHEHCPAALRPLTAEIAGLTEDQAALRTGVLRLIDRFEAVRREFQKIAPNVLAAVEATAARFAVSASPTTEGPIGTRLYGLLPRDGAIGVLGSERFAPCRHAAPEGLGRPHLFAHARVCAIFAAAHREYDPPLVPRRDPDADRAGAY